MGNQRRGERKKKLSKAFFSSLNVYDNAIRDRIDKLTSGGHEAGGGGGKIYNSDARSSRLSLVSTFRRLFTFKRFKISSDRVVRQ